jgi:regulator of RNase E activity RraA
MAASDTMTLLSQETLENLKATSTATLTTQLFKRGYRNCFIQGVRPLTKLAGNMVGPAFTLRYVPAREDLDSYSAKPDPNSLQREAIETVPAGHILVMDCRGDPRAASAGDVYLTRLQVRGVAGVVSDGGMRDSEPISQMNIPAFCAGPSAPTNRVLHHAVDFNLPIGCGGVAVYPDDVLVGDADGVTVIPRAIVDDVARDGIEQERLEHYILMRVANGESLRGLYPINETTRADYTVWLSQQTDCNDRHLIS